MYTYHVLRVDRVVDGDTVDVTLDLGFGVSIKQRLRIFGVDAPEMRSSNDEERIKAKAAKVFAENWLLSGGQMIVTTYKDDKYGRMLGDFKKGPDSESFSEALLLAGFAKPYLG